jgi:lysine 2,3-aminomutase
MGEDCIAPVEEEPPGKDDWKWQLKNSITSFEELEKLIQLEEHEKVNKKLKFRITPYYLDVIKKSSALRKTMIPTLYEDIVLPEEAADPLHEDDQSPVSNIVHRYPDRVLFLVTNFCSANCRYCTRSRMIENSNRSINTRQWESGIEYIKQHPEIRDVLISGGDPLTLPGTQLEFLLSSIRKIEHVEIIRIGTKVPAVLPQRITKDLVNILKKYHPLYINIHFTHPDELTKETKNACEMLANAGIPLGSQTVLLKDVNDDVQTMKKLMTGLLKIRVKPYYIYQCDPVQGTSHFRTTVEKGLEIIRGLQGFTSGLAVPHYIIDAPGGGGKIPISPDYYKIDGEGKIILTNYKSQQYTYP